MRLALTIDFEFEIGGDRPAVAASRQAGRAFGNGQMFPDKSAHRFRPADLGRRVTLPPPTFPPARSVSKSIPRCHSGQQGPTLSWSGSAVCERYPRLPCSGPGGNVVDVRAPGTVLKFPRTMPFAIPVRPKVNTLGKSLGVSGWTRLNRATSPYALFWRDQPVS